MKYFIDCEFIEGFKKPFGGKRRHFIDLISIGIYCEDGRSYYAVSNEYKYKDASEWVRKNVIAKIYQEQIPAFKQQFMNIKTFHKYINDGKSIYEISRDIREFCGAAMFIDALVKDKDIQFYGYYSDYDWVLLCSLFGTMMQLPKGFPMYCIDLKQTLDEKKEIILNDTLGMVSDNRYYFESQHKGNSLVVNKESFDFKKHPAYPKQTNEHNALSDAKWNYELYKFLQSV